MIYINIKLVFMIKETPLIRPLVAIVTSLLDKYVNYTIIM